MSPVLRIVAAVIRLGGVDAAKVAATVDPVEQPGTALDVVTRCRIDPGGMQLIAGAEVEGDHPGEQIVTPLLPPALQIGIADAALIGVDQVETAVAAAAAVKLRIHPHSPQGRRSPPADLPAVPG